MNISIVKSNFKNDERLTSQTRPELWEIPIDFLSEYVQFLDYIIIILIMSYTSTYLNFATETEEAFLFYKSVFGGEFEWTIHRFGDVPAQEWTPPLAESDKNLIMHICLPILGEHKLMGTDAPPSMGFIVNQGNSVHISLHPDSREETEKLFNWLMEGGTIEMPLQDMFWGTYYGSGRDKFGVQWMVNFEGN